MLDKKSVVNCAINFVMTNTTEWDDEDDVRDKFYYMEYPDHELEGEGLFWKDDRAYGTLENICGYLYDVGEFRLEINRLGYDPDSDDMPFTAIQNVVTSNVYINTVDVSDLNDGHYEDLLIWMGVDCDDLIEWCNIAGWGGGYLRDKYRVTPYELEVFGRLKSQTGDKNMYALVALHILDRSPDNRWLHQGIMMDISRHLTWYVDELNFNLNELWDAEF